jgi:hypothetical protein
VLAEPITRTTPRPVRHVLTTQRWREVAFVHWEVDPASVAPLLPAGTEPDTLDGATYVGLVAFQMASVGVLRSPGIPYLGSFPETNVRLYSVDPLGRRGIVFCSMDAARLLPVLAGRCAGLPYRWSRMSVCGADRQWDYTMRRHLGRPVVSSVTVEVGAAAEPSALDDFLTARWGLHFSRAGALWYWPTEHPAWRLHAASLITCDGELVSTAIGWSLLSEGPTSVLWSPGVPARFGYPRRVGRVGRVDRVGRVG